MNLIKITRIKKGMNVEKLESDQKPNNGQVSVIKCAKCQQINMLSNAKI